MWSDTARTGAWCGGGDGPSGRGGGAAWAAAGRSVRRTRARGTTGRRTGKGAGLTGRSGRAGPTSGSSTSGARVGRHERHWIGGRPSGGSTLQRVGHATLAMPSLSAHDSAERRRPTYAHTHSRTPSDRWRPVLGRAAHRAADCDRVPVQVHGCDGGPGAAGRPSGAHWGARRPPGRARRPRRPRRPGRPRVHRSAGFPPRAHGARRALARLQGDGRSTAAGAADPALLTARQVRGGPGRGRSAVQCRAGRLRLLRSLRADRRDREVRHRARHQVRDLRDQPDPRRDHRRAARAGLDPSLGAAEGEGGRAHLRDAGGQAAADAHRARGRGRDGHRDRGSAHHLQPALARQRGRARRAAPPGRRRRRPAEPDGDVGGPRGGRPGRGGRGPGAAAGCWRRRSTPFPNGRRPW